MKKEHNQVTGSGTRKYINVWRTNLETEKLDYVTLRFLDPHWL